MNHLFIFGVNSLIMDRWVLFIGFLSATLTTAAFVPQAVKTWRTRSTSDLSPLMFALFCTGILGWLIYGIYINSLPMILANAVTIVLAGTIMFFIIRGSSQLKIAHIALYTSDIEKMKMFYCDTFNAKAGPMYHNPGKNFTSYFIHFHSGARLEIMHQLIDTVTSKLINPGHFAVSVGSRERVDQLTNELRNKDVPIISEPRMTGDGYYESVIADPEGNQIEITV
jgi:lactoylglutathione lyase